MPLNDEDKKIYNETLDVTGTGMMGYVEIPKINVSLPIIMVQMLKSYRLR
mgnify:CR=1 FL=1